MEGRHNADPTKVFLSEEKRPDDLRNQDIGPDCHSKRNWAYDISYGGKETPGAANKGGELIAFFYQV